MLTWAMMYCYCPEMLKALDTVGLSWLAHLFNVIQRSGTVSVDWQTGVEGKADARLLESRRQLIVEPLIQEEQCGFCPGRGTVDQLFTLQGYWRGHGSSHIQSTCTLWT